MACERSRFAWLLAREWEWEHPNDLLLHLGEEKFEEWWTYYQICPWGPERDEHLARMQAVVHGAPGRPEVLKFPSSFEVLKQLSAIANDDEQQPLDAAMGVLRRVGLGK
jgi:hypothetical protein